LPLGATIANGTTQFRVWAPTARRVSLFTYASAAGEAASVDEMTLDQATGIWSTTRAGDLSGTAYRYGVDVFVRGVGLVQDTADLESIPVMPHSGTPLYLRDVATVRVGGDFRRGALDVGGREVVGGIVVIRYGENAYRVIQDIKARLASLAPGLPEGVSVVSL
jgi:Cu/Ag efflux pump CusA